MSISLVFFRFWVRIRSFGHLFIDDGFVMLAWLQLFITAILWEIRKDGLVTIYDLAGERISPSPDNLQRVLDFSRATVGFELIFYVCLYSIKASFLFFFRRITDRVMGLRVLWWSVMGLTVVAFISCISIIPYRCLLATLDVQKKICPADYRAAHFQKTLIYASLIDVVTDLAIIAIPTAMLWNFQVNLQKKLALIGLFSLTIIVITFAIIRFAVIKGGYNFQPDTSWLFLWSSGEMALAIIVACLASFRQLFVIQDKRTHIKPTTNSPQSSMSRKFALPRLRISHSLRRNKPIPLLPTEKASTVDLPRISSSSVPHGRNGPTRKYESKLEQQIGTDTQLTNNVTNDSSMDTHNEGIRYENVSFILPLQSESQTGTTENLVARDEG